MIIFQVTDYDKIAWGIHLSHEHSADLKLMLVKNSILKWLTKKSTQETIYSKRNNLSLNYKSLRFLMQVSKMIQNS